MPSNSTMRVLSRSRCNSRVCRAWAIKSSSVASTVRCKVRCTVATSLTDSAIMRVSSCTRVKRSNSSGSKPACNSLACAKRDCIWVSACNSMSRNCWRKRFKLSVMSPSEPRSWLSSTSSRERVIMTSPAWLTMRSSSCERTRIDAVAACRKGCMAMVCGAGINALPGARGVATGAAGSRVVSSAECKVCACTAGRSATESGTLEATLGAAYSDAVTAAGAGAAAW